MKVGDRPAAAAKAGCLPRCDSAARGFTLIELMAVIAIIGMLMSLTLAGLNAIAIKTMKQDLELVDFLTVDADGFALAVDGDGWHFWTDGDGDDHRFEIGRELDPANPAWVSEFTPYLNRPKRCYFPATKRQIRKRQVIDAWGTPIRYELHEIHHHDGDVGDPNDPEWVIEVERLVSAGRDMEWDTDDDVILVLGNRKKVTSPWPPS